jgi:hypothetical protein
MRWSLPTSARTFAPDDGTTSGAPEVSQEAPAGLEVVEQPATQPDAPASETETPTDPDPKPKPKRTDRHIAHLTAAKTAAETALVAANRRAEAAEALLNAGKETPAAPRAANDVEARAAALVAEREFNARLAAIDAAGIKADAEGWDQVKTTMIGLGATANQAFLQALAETENATKIYTELAEDPDALMELLAKSPAAMAAKLGRMDAKLSQPAVRPLSSAPVPPPKIVPSGVVRDANPYEYPSGMSMKEWNKMMDNHLPPSLGGKRKSA